MYVRIKRVGLTGGVVRGGIVLRGGAVICTQVVSELHLLANIHQKNTTNSIKISMEIVVCVNRGCGGIFHPRI